MSLREQDLRIEVYRAGLYRPCCVVRVTHNPTGLHATSGQHESSIGAKAEAMALLTELVEG